MKKRLLISSFFFLTSIAFFAQKDRVEYLPSFDKRKLHYGFYLGLNQNDYKFSYHNRSSVPNGNITAEPSIGFNVGLIADLRLHKNLNLRFEPGLMTNAKKIYFNHIATAQDSVREVSSTYLHLPILFKFSTDRIKNIRPYLLAGVSFDYNFSSNEANQDDNSAGQFRMRSSNAMYELGIGIDIYLYYFKFSPSIRGVFAMTNEIKPDDDPNSQWTAPINGMRTRGLFLSLAFE